MLQRNYFLFQYRRKLHCEQNPRFNDIEIPKELVLEILQRVCRVGNAQDLVSLSKVNKQFHLIINYIFGDFVDNRELATEVLVHKIFRFFDANLKPIAQYTNSKLPSFWAQDTEEGVRKRWKMLVDSYIAASIFAIIGAYCTLHIEDHFVSLVSLVTILSTFAVTPLLLFLVLGVISIFPEVVEKEVGRRPSVINKLISDLALVPTEKKSQALV